MFMPNFSTNISGCFSLDIQVQNLLPQLSKLSKPKKKKEKKKE